MALEDLVFNDQGRLLTDSLTTYKIPDLHFAPGEVEVVFLENAANPRAILQSKAIGEPPFCLAIAVFCALRHRDSFADAVVASVEPTIEDGSAMISSPGDRVRPMARAR